MSTRAYLSIGDVLTLLREEFPDVTISKIRFLESQGLVNPERSPSGYRKFFEPDVERLRWVLRQQREHFLPLKVIRDRLVATGSDGVPEPLGGEPEPEVQVLAHAPAMAHAALGTGAQRSPLPVEAVEPDFNPVTELDTSSETALTRLMPAADGGERRPSPAQEGPADRGPVASASHPPPLAQPVPPAPAFRGALGPERSAPAGGSREHGSHTAGMAIAPAGGEAEGPDVRGVTPRLGPNAVATGSPARPPAAEPRPPVPPRPSVPIPPAPSVPAPSAPGLTVTRSPRPERGVGPANPARPGAPADRSSGATNVDASSFFQGPDPSVSTGTSMTPDELQAATGLSAEDLAALEGFGVLEPMIVAGAVYYDEDALVAARIAADFGRYGIEPRHLRLYRNAVDREVGLIEQIVTPLLRQRNPEARQRAVDAAADVAKLGQALRSSLLRRELRRHFGH